MAIDTTAPQKKMNKTFLLYLPEGEHHELGLLFMYYLLKRRGAEIIYLGANIPLKDAEYVANLKKPDFAFIHLTATGANFNFGKFLNNIQQRFGKTNTIISGYLTQHYSKKVPSGIQLKKSLSEVMDWVSAL